MKFHEVTGQQKGALGEALFSVYHGPREIFASWMYHDLHQHEKLCPESPQELSVHRCHRNQCEFHHCDPFDDRPGWFPDIHFYVQPDSEKKSMRLDGPRFEYVLEVKTGASASLSSNQRDVMEHLEKTAGRVIPVRARVDISRLPKEFGVAFTRIHGRW
jgi:hypothetical protein